MIYCALSNVPLKVHGDVWFESFNIAYTGVGVMFFPPLGFALSKAICISPPLRLSVLSCSRRPRAFRTLQEGIRCMYDNWRIWENYMLVKLQSGIYCAAANGLSDCTDQNASIKKLEGLKFWSLRDLASRQNCINACKHKKTSENCQLSFFRLRVWKERFEDNVVPFKTIH